ncbi:hypothetical protein, partial [Mesorhizobium sp. M1A.F.Ca.IN.022.02.1.1]|uniref:hypothetical protein n=1 Tax=Mesorhizobium sp. M1A.F.Ca.IN.022.02.1.1 TaxID=2496766 RepID=UPI0019CFFB62
MADRFDCTTAFSVPVIGPNQNLGRMFRFGEKNAGRIGILRAAGFNSVCPGPVGRGGGRHGRAAVEFGEVDDRLQQALPERHLGGPAEKLLRSGYI